MLKSQTIIKAFLLVIIALLGSQHSAFAEPMNNSVKDCLEHKEKCQDNGLAGKEKGQAQAGKGTVGVTVWDFVKMIFATVFVVALLYFLLKFINKRSRSFKTTQLVENLGGTSLGANRSVQIIKVANQVFIVGVGENIQLLKEIDDPEIRSQLIADYNSKMDQLIQPSDIVTKFIERTKSRNMGSSDDSSSFSAHLKKQLDDLAKGRKKMFEDLEKKGPDKK